MQKDIEFMSNLSAAIVQQNRRESKMIVNLVLLALVLLVVWAHYAKIDQITRGTGKIVTTSKVQVIQNLEGGIISEVMVKTGDMVEKDQPLLKIENKKFASHFEESLLKLGELKLKAARLRAESGLKPQFDAMLAKQQPDLVVGEKKLFKSHMDFLKNQKEIVKHQISQKKTHILDSSSRIVHLKSNRTLLNEQISMTEPLVERGIESKTNFLKLKRELIGINENIESETYAIKNARGAIRELNSKIDDLKMSFRNRAQKELNETIAHISQILEKQTSLKDQVTRTLVKSPLKGIVKQIFVNTIGGVARPGMDLIEIVPQEDSLLAEVRIKPSDIAFLHPGQTSTVKCTAYDFSLYGGLDGEITKISADTLTDKKEQSYYLIYVKTNKNYLGTIDKPMKIIPGMTVSVDILTGKRSILDYLLKPIFQIKAKALTERS
jgi:adhesin transport system membrane fusion protein